MAVAPRAGGPSLVPVQVDEDSAEQERQLLGEFGLAHSPFHAATVTIRRGRSSSSSGDEATPSRSSAISGCCASVPPPRRLPLTLRVATPAVLSGISRTPSVRVCTANKVHMCCDGY